MKQMLKDCINKDKISTKIPFNGILSDERLFFERLFAVDAVNIAAAYRFVDQLENLVLLISKIDFSFCLLI